VVGAEKASGVIRAVLVHVPILRENPGWVNECGWNFYGLKTTSMLVRYKYSEIIPPFSYTTSKASVRSGTV